MSISRITLGYLIYRIRKKCPLPAGTPSPAPLLAVHSVVDAPGDQVLLDHQRHLEGDGVVKLPQIQSGKLLDLLQAVHQGVPVDKELPSRLGYVQVVLKELVDGEQGLLVQGVDGVLLKHLLKEHLAQGGGQLVDQPADTQILVIDDALLRVEHPAHVDGDPRLLVGPGQLPDVAHDGADADDHPHMELLGDLLLDLLGDLIELPWLRPLRELLDEGHVSLADREDEVHLLVGEQGMHHVNEGGIAGLHLADQEHRPGRLGDKVQLLGADIDVPQQNVVGDDVLDKGGLVVLLLIVGLGAVQRHRGHGAEHLRLGVLTLDKGGIVELGPPAGQGLEGAPVKADRVSLAPVDRLHGARPVLPDAAQLIAGHHRSLRIDHADGSLRAVLHL